MHLLDHILAVPWQPPIELKVAAPPRTAPEVVHAHLAAGEVKIDTEQRLISGHAAGVGNLDRNGDIIEAGAFTKTLAERGTQGVTVLIGHDTSQLPIGVPVAMREDSVGLHFTAKIFEGARGDELLSTAKALLDSGQTLGVSIGFRVTQSEWEERADDPAAAPFGGVIRKIKELDLREFSFAAEPLIANPKATVKEVKHEAPQGAPSREVRAVADGLVELADQMHDEHTAQRSLGQEVKLTEASEEKLRALRDRIEALLEGDTDSGGGTLSGDEAKRRIDVLDLSASLLEV